MVDKRPGGKFSISSFVRRANIDCIFEIIKTLFNIPPFLIIEVVLFGIIPGIAEYSG